VDTAGRDRQFCEQIPRVRYPSSAEGFVADAKLGVWATRKASILDAGTDPHVTFLSLDKGQQADVNAIGMSGDHAVRKSLILWLIGARRGHGRPVGKVYDLWSICPSRFALRLSGIANKHGQKLKR
jgi:hypothetical protein